MPAQRVVVYTVNKGFLAIEHKLRNHPHHISQKFHVSRSRPCIASFSKMCHFTKYMIMQTTRHREIEWHLVIIISWFVYACKKKIFNLIE